MASTGVIGEPLALAEDHADAGQLADSGAAGGWRAAAEAIMTTDTYPKTGHRAAEIDGHRVTINGIAKGSGMIAPDMATMLAFVFTDANLPAPVLQECFRRAWEFVQRHHGGLRHLHQRHAAAVRHGQRAPITRDRQSGRQAACRISARSSTPCCSIWRCRWCATAKARRN